MKQVSARMCLLLLCLSLTACGGSVYTYEYGANGNIIRETGTLADGSSYEYDENGHIIE